MRTDLALRAAYQALTPDLERCSELIEEFGDLIDHLDKIGLILLCPEVFRLGVAEQFVRRLNSDGLRLIDFSIRSPLGADEIAAMFVPAFQPRRYRYWLIERRFSMGPTVAILVRHDSKRTLPVGPALKLLKGARVPKNCSPGTWRGDFPSINGVLNLVHTADSSAELIRNSSPFFTVQHLKTAVCATVGGHPAIDWIEFSNFVATGLQENCNAGELDFPNVQAATIGRCLAQLYSNERVRCLDVAREVRNLASTLDQNLKLTLAGLDPASRLLASLLAPDRHTLDWEKLIGSAVSYGVHITEWEQLVLMTTLYYADEEL